MRRKAILILLLLGYSCTGLRGYELIIGRSYFSRDSLRGIFGFQLLGKAKVGDNCEIRGIYAIKKGFPQNYPVVRFYQRDGGKRYVLLTKELDMEEGTLVHVKGRVVSREISYGALKKSYYYNFLEPEDCRIIFDTRGLRDKTQEEYSKIREDLESKITPKGSHLKLMPNPHWEVLWCKDDGSFIVSTRMYDLMYEADIDFVFDGETKRLKQVYAYEWFKGEM